jgi:hypothetical protein
VEPESSSTHPSSRLTGQLAISLIGWPATVTASASGRNRAPPHTGQGRRVMNSSILDRT